ncbi:hypothetical protein [Haloquadratum walsbyi]|uniref:Uncharacterized protein n=1 Tax=Haloquadratum walsbyi J07HQW2 TaxID=1238425 RepID=U1NIL9_9EURY|nr:hypothetical protein [Haloquadratum walsbyi]ERG97055.1 MAG: hypothetical protein J07HQW2_03541 [Haloquadratum walsbyi J07HQW2]
MLKQVSEQFNSMIDTNSKITFIFVIIGLASWLGTRMIIDNQQIQLIVLFTVGIIIPTLINEWRE